MSQTDLYRWFDENNNLLYVGISINAYKRAKEHSNKGWFEKATKMTVEKYSTREQALAAEKLAIQQEKPKYNIVHAIQEGTMRFFTISGAAKITGKSEMTIRKYLGLQDRPCRLPNAKKVLQEGNLQEVWQIPESDLWQAGLMSRQNNILENPTHNKSRNDIELMQEIINLQSQTIIKLMQLQNIRG